MLPGHSAACVQLSWFTRPNYDVSITQTADNPTAATLGGRLSFGCKDPQVSPKAHLAARYSTLKTAPDHQSSSQTPQVPQPHSGVPAGARHDPRAQGVYAESVDVTMVAVTDVYTLAGSDVPSPDG